MTQRVLFPKAKTEVCESRVPTAGQAAQALPLGAHRPCSTPPASEAQQCEFLQVVAPGASGSCMALVPGTGHTVHK